MFTFSAQRLREKQCTECGFVSPDNGMTDCPICSRLLLSNPSIYTMAAAAPPAEVKYVIGGQPHTLKLLGDSHGVFHGIFHNTKNPATHNIANPKNQIPSNVHVFVTDKNSLLAIHDALAPTNEFSLILKARNFRQQSRFR